MFSLGQPASHQPKRKDKARNNFFPPAYRGKLRPCYDLPPYLSLLFPCTLEHVPVCVSVPAHRWVQFVPFAQLLLLKNSLTSNGFSLPIQMTSYQFIFQGIIQSSYIRSCLLYQLSIPMTDTCIDIVNANLFGMVKLHVLSQINSLCK